MGRKKAAVADPVATIEQTATDIRAISLDMGNAYSNLQADGGISADWRSIQGVVSENSRIGDLPFDTVINYDGAWRAYGELAPTYTNRIEDYPTTERYTSRFYKRLFAYALHRAYGLRVQESPFYPKVIVSIPAKEYANNDRVQQVKANLSGAYLIENTQGATLQVEIMTDKLTIIPEGAGTFFYQLKAADVGGASVVASGLWYVLDLGYLTADVLAFKDSDYMPDNASSRTNLGMRVIAERIAKYVRGKNGPDLDPSDYDRELQCDSISRNGHQYAIAETRNQALADVGERITRFLTQEASGQNLAGVLLTGGGAELLRPYISAPGLPAIILVQHPRRANVEGAYKLLTE